MPKKTLDDNLNKLRDDAYKVLAATGYNGNRHFKSEFMMSEAEAEHALANKKEGQFILRKSSDNTNLTLSYIAQGKVIHKRVDNTDKYPLEEMINNLRAISIISEQDRLKTTDTLKRYQNNQLNFTNAKDINDFAHAMTYLRDRGEKGERKAVSIIARLPEDSRNRVLEKIGEDYISGMVANEASRLSVATRFFSDSTLTRSMKALDIITNPVNTRPKK